LQYSRAFQLHSEGHFYEAAEVFAQIDRGFMDSAEQANNSGYSHAAALLENGAFAEAERAFVALGTYRDSATQANRTRYMSFEAMLENGETSAANCV
jgi:hypothetical protein